MNLLRVSTDLPLTDKLREQSSEYFLDINEPILNHPFAGIVQQWIMRPVTVDLLRRVSRSPTPRAGSTTALQVC